MNQPPAEASISTRLLTRLIIGLIALWSLVAGIVLVGFHGAGTGALGAGVGDEAGQRLAGAQMLVLVPVYVVLLWQLDRYQALLWLPFAAQLAIVCAVAYNIVTGVTAFEDGILAVAVSAILGSLLGFVWITEQRTLASQKLEEAELDEADTPPRQ
jgi:hypothetical protein